jgi:general secretion pathway protein D
LDDLLDIATPDASDDEVAVTTQGVTVQLPIIATTSVSTVVSVPDGGTILLGGIKRMTEQRTERGLPFLSNIPYINRLFKNVSIGRDTQNLMMMVTPRIIIQAEEEAAQIGETSN